MACSCVRVWLCRPYMPRNWVDYWIQSYDGNTSSFVMSDGEKHEIQQLSHLASAQPQSHQV